MAKQHTSGERHWYAIHTYSGYENAVTRNLKQRIDSLNMNDKIFTYELTVANYSDMDDIDEEDRYNIEDIDEPFVKFGDVFKV